MREYIVELFANYSNIILFLHVIGAVVWIGGMIAIRFSVHYALQDINEPKKKLEITINIIGRFLKLLIVPIIFVGFSAVILVIGLDLKHSSMSKITLIKEIIYTVMIFVYLFAFYKRNKAKSFFEAVDFKSAKSELLPLSKYIIPINIILGTIAISLGVILRGI